MVMLKVSVVIPVYNGECYLHQCLDSVCSQTLEEIEIICVDDGSTDTSWQILEEYREKDTRFRLLRQENRHVAAARNNGLAQAEGKYVIFWDCDDFFEPKALELLYLQAEGAKADICVCRCDLYYHKDGKRYPFDASLILKRVPEGETFNRFTNPEHILGFTNNPVWNKLFRRSFLIENGLTFPDFHMSEDRMFLFIALCLAQRITTVNKVLIHYRWNNPESLVGKYEEPLESLKCLEATVDELRRRGIALEFLGKRTIQNVITSLHLIQTEEDFMAALQYLRAGGLLEKLDIQERGPEYYYTTSNYEYAKHLLYDKPGDLMAFFKHDAWQKQRVISADRQRLKAQLKRLKNRFRKDKEVYESKLLEMAEENRRLLSECETLALELERRTAQVVSLKKQLKTVKETMRTLQNSWNYRLGQMLLYLPRIIRKVFRQIACKTI